MLHRLKGPLAPGPRCSARGYERQKRDRKAGEMHSRFVWIGEKKDNYVHLFGNIPQILNTSETVRARGTTIMSCKYLLIVPDGS